MTIGYKGLKVGTVAEANANIADLRATVAALQADIAQMRVELGPIPNFERDGYLDNPVHVEIHSIRLILDAMATGGTPATPPAPAPNIELPPPVYAPIGAYGLPIQAMTKAQIDAFVDAVAAGLNNGLTAEQITKITLDVVAGIYPVQDVPTIEGVKYLYYNGGNQAALKPYLSAIDQRDLATNQLLPSSDPRVIKVSGISGGSTPVPIPAPTGPLTVIPGDLQVNGRISIGGPLKELYGELLQIFGQGDASIYLEANQNGTGPQLAGKTACFDISVSGGDGGGRFRQNWKDGKSADGIRPMAVRGFDSQGTPSLQQRHVGEETIYGQDMWTIVSHANKTVDIVCPLPGYKLRICQTPAGAGYANSTDIR